VFGQADLAINLGDFVQKNWRGGNQGRINNALMRAASEGKEKMQTPEYAELARCFSQEIDAIKSGQHVKMDRVTKLEDKLLALPHGRSPAEPKFLAYDEYLKLKNPNLSQRLMEVDSLIGKVFARGFQQHERLACIRHIVHKLDSDLEVAWGRQDENLKTRLLLSAKNFWIAYKNQRQRSSHSESQEVPRGELRREALKRYNAPRIAPRDTFIQDQRKLACDRAHALGVDLEWFALAMYMEKYQPLMQNAQLDRCSFPWDLVAQELISIKLKFSSTRALVIDQRVLQDLVKVLQGGHGVVGRQSQATRDDHA